MTRIKICGLRREEDVAIVNRYRPDYAGFILAPGFRRSITLQRFRQLRELLSPGIKAVGVFVDQEPELIASLLCAGSIDMAQLHGREDNVYIDRLRSMTEGQVIQAFRIGGTADLKRAEESRADLVLLDGGAGAGRAFDWALTAQMDRAYLLAGGLTPENVESALERNRPFGVDVSSGVETDRRKDEGKVREFIETVRERA